MKLIQVVVRPEREREVVEQLERAGIQAFTRLDVFGRGRQRGLVAGTVRYDELAKTWIMLAVEDDLVDRAVDTIRIAACTGNPGDGKIFIAPLAAARTIREARAEAAAPAPSSSA